MLKDEIVFAVSSFFRKFAPEFKLKTNLNMELISKKKRFEWLDQAIEYINDPDDYYEEFLVNQFDDNYYGEYTFNFPYPYLVELESIWTDADNHINCHVSCPDYEGDFLFKSLAKEVQLDIIEVIRKHVENEDIEITDYSTGEPIKINLD